MENQENQIVQYLSGNMSPEEVTAFELLLASSPDLQREFSSFERSWKLTNQLYYSEHHTNDAWSSFQTEVKAPISILGFDWRKIAASITLLAAISVGLYFYTGSDITTIAASAQQEIEMADRSNIVLAKNASLSYSEFTNENRQVNLSGEAYFDVAKSEAPFTIVTKQGEIMVLGTDFQVFSSDADILSVELFSGSIAFKHNGETTKLEAGYQLYVDGDKLYISDLNKTKHNLTDNKITCTNKPLSYILEQLSTVYKVAYSAKDKWLKENYTVTLPKNNLAECLELLTSISDRNFAIEDSVIVVK